MREWTTAEIIEHLRATAEELKARAAEPGTTPDTHAMRWGKAVALMAAADEIEHHKGEPRRRAT